MGTPGYYTFGERFSPNIVVVPGVKNLQAMNDALEKAINARKEQSEDNKPPGVPGAPAGSGGHPGDETPFNPNRGLKFTAVEIIDGLLTDDANDEAVLEADIE